MLYTEGNLDENGHNFNDEENNMRNEENRNLLYNRNNGERNGLHESQGGGGIP